MVSVEEKRLKERVLKAISEALQPLGFVRTKPTYYVRARHEVAEFVHVHKFTFGPYLRVHVGIRVLNSPSESIALNGPDSDSVAKWSLLPISERKYRIEYSDNEQSIGKCVSTVSKFVTKEGRRWFAKWHDLQKLASDPKSPLTSEDRQALKEALSGNEDRQRVEASKRLFKIVGS